jgi:hypothetical protein
MESSFYLFFGEHGSSRNVPYLKALALAGVPVYYAWKDGDGVQELYERMMTTQPSGRSWPVLMRVNPSARSRCMVQTADAEHLKEILMTEESHEGVTDCTKLDMKSMKQLMDTDSDDAHFLVFALVGCPYSIGAVDELKSKGRRMNVTWVRRGTPEQEAARRRFSELTDGQTLPSWPQVFRVLPGDKAACLIGGFSSLKEFLQDPSQLKGCGCTSEEAQQ